MSVTTYKWTIEQWHLLVKTGVLAGQNVEFVEGEIIRMSPEGIEHRFTSESMVIYLRDKFSQLAHVTEAHPITLDNSEPEPDVAVVKLPLTNYRTHHPYPEDIYFLIEIANSTLQFDRETKAKVYARNGISEYWIVDLFNRQLIVHTSPEAEGYRTINEYQTGTISPQSFLDIDIALNRLLLF